VELIIGGRRYHVTRDDSRTGPRWFVETSNPAKIYEVRRELDERQNCYLPYACDCPDFLNRHAGTGSNGCKHLKALSAYGILPSLDCQLAPSNPGWVPSAMDRSEPEYREDR
jgi:hypothetical protein